MSNARERGTEVDQLVTAYLSGNLNNIPKGTRLDSVELFDKVRRWFDLQHFSDIKVQVLLGDEDHGGIVDMILDGVPFELKATYNVMDSHRLQAAGYEALSGATDGHILHVTERFALPRIVPIVFADRDDWQMLLSHFRMLQRRSKGKALDEAEEKEA